MSATGPLRLAIVGWPVARSLSPALWEAVARRRGLDLEYAACPVPPDGQTAWRSLWTSGLSAFNVTAPWKERAAARCDRRVGPAEAIGAVNTAIRRGELWEGHSTDGYGFVRSLLAAGEPLQGRRLAVLGTGGAGRAVALAASQAGAAVTLVSRTPSRVPRGCADLERIDWEALLGRTFDAVVNATPLGRDTDSAMPPVPFERCCPAGLAVDLNYEPRITAFLRRAHDAGARTLNGVGMLIHQAALAAALIVDGDPSAAESYEADFVAAAREIADGSP